MYRLIKNAVVFILVTALVFLALNWVYMTYFNRYSIASGVARFSDVPNTISLANVGGSHGECAFNYEDYSPYSPFNFAMSAQMLVYDHRMLDYYQEYIAPGALIFIPMSHISLYRDFRASKDFLAKNQEYYYLLDPAHIIDYDYKQYLIVRQFPLLNGENVIKGVIRGFTTGFTRDLKDTDWTKTIKSSQDAEADGIARTISHFAHLSLPPTPDPESMESVRRIIALCREKNWQPVFVTTPVTTYYHDNIPQAFKDDFKAQIATLSTELSVPQLDYSRDGRFINDLNNFRDADHLNKSGARAFTDIVMTDAQALGFAPIVPKK